MRQFHGNHQCSTCGISGARHCELCAGCSGGGVCEVVGQPFWQPLADAVAAAMPVCQAVSPGCDWPDCPCG